MECPSSRPKEGTSADATSSDSPTTNRWQGPRACLCSGRYYSSFPIACSPSLPGKGPRWMSASRQGFAGGGDDRQVPIRVQGWRSVLMAAALAVSLLIALGIIWGQGWRTGRPHHRASRLSWGGWGGVVAALLVVNVVTTFLIVGNAAMYANLSNLTSWSGPSNDRLWVAGCTLKTASAIASWWPFAEEVRLG